MANPQKTHINLIQQAARQFYDGQFQSALDLCKTLLKKQKNNVDALNLAGIVSDKLDKKNLAVDYFKRATKLAPNNAEILNNLGTTYLDLDEIESSINCFKKATRHNPQYVEAWFNLGNSYLKQQDLEQAKTCYQTTIKLDPSHIRALNNLGNVFHIQLEHESAIQCYLAALNIRPDFSESLFSLASVYYDIKNNAEAEKLLRHVLRLTPDHVRANYLLGNLLFHQDKNNTEAITYFEKSLQLDEQQVDVCNSLGAALHYQNRYDEAIEILQKAISLNPAFADSHNTLGLVLHEQGDIKAAKSCYEQAIAAKPDFSQAHNNLGHILKEQENYTDAIELFQQALKISPDSPSAVNNLALTELVTGDFGNGWKHYRHRPSVPENGMTVCPDKLPDNLENKTIFIMKDQGIGDELFFLRFLPQLKNKGARIFYCCDEKLLTLLKRLNLFEQLSTEPFEPGDFDFSFSVGDLPYLLNHTQADQSPDPLQLHTDPNKTQQIKKLLSEFGQPPYIGISWRGGGIRNNKRIGSYFKEIDPRYLSEELAKLPGTFVSLQRIAGQDELQNISFKLGRPILNLDPYNNDLDAMLSLLDSLDYYIGVSNTNVHLRAGLNKTSHVLVTHPPEWRWGAKGRKSHWFPHCLVYRQSIEHQWQAAINQLIADLSNNESYTS